jgi:hypothetical protein
MFEITPIVLILVAGVVVAVGWTGAILIQRREARAFAKYSRADGYSFTAQAALPAGLVGCDFYLFALTGDRIENVCTGSYHGINVQILTCSQTLGTDDDARTVSQTVVVVTDKNRDWPRFSLRSKGKWPELAASHGLRPVEPKLGEYDALWEFYDLDAQDEAAMSTIFRPDVVAHFLKKPGLFIEARGPYMIVYRPGRTYRADRLRSLLRRRKETYDLLCGLYNRPGSRRMSDAGVTSPQY